MPAPCTYQHAVGEIRRPRGGAEVSYRDGIYLSMGLGVCDVAWMDGWVDGWVGEEEKPSSTNLNESGPASKSK